MSLWHKLGSVPTPCVVPCTQSPAKSQEVGHCSQEHDERGSSTQACQDRAPAMQQAHPTCETGSSLSSPRSAALGFSGLLVVLWVSTPRVSTPKLMSPALIVLVHFACLSWGLVYMERESAIRCLQMSVLTCFSVYRGSHWCCRPLRGVR